MPGAPSCRWTSAGSRGPGAPSRRRSPCCPKATTGTERTSVGSLRCHIRTGMIQRCGTGWSRRFDELVQRVDEGAQLAETALREPEADASEVDGVVVLHLFGARVGALDPALAGDEMGEALVQGVELGVVGGPLETDHEVLADVADRVVVGVEARDLPGSGHDVVRDEE